jgi:hypothetical protein
MVTASCLCGAVKFELAKAPEFVVVCHCSRCRKVGSSAFVMTRKENLNLLSGADQIGQVATDDQFSLPRCFCRSCGTALGEILSTEDVFPISAHCLDEDLNLEVRLHEHVATKPSWYVIGDDAKQFDGDPK